MANSTNNLSIVISQQDSNNVNIVNRLIGAISFAGIVGTFIEGRVLSVSQQTITLPVAQPLQFYFKNTDTVAEFTIVWTPQGGASATVQVLGPGAVILFWQPATDTDYGVSDIKYTSDTNPGSFEYFIGG